MDNVIDKTLYTDSANLITENFVCGLFSITLTATA